LEFLRTANGREECTENGSNYFERMKSDRTGLRQRRIAGFCDEADIRSSSIRGMFPAR
jgi:hypothetical protein